MASLRWAVGGIFKMRHFFCLCCSSPSRYWKIPFYSSETQLPLPTKKMPVQDLSHDFCSSWRRFRGRILEYAVYSWTLTRTAPLKTRRTKYKHSLVFIIRVFRMFFQIYPTSNSLFPISAVWMIFLFALLLIFFSNFGILGWRNSFQRNWLESSDKQRWCEDWQRKRFAWCRSRCLYATLPDKCHLCGKSHSSLFFFLYQNPNNF